MEHSNFFNLSIPKPDDKTSGLDRKPKVPFRKQTTVKSLTDWINLQEYSDDIKAGLIIKLTAYPQSALAHFKKNIDKHVNMIIVNSKKNK
jgi:hypothetical protein